MISFNAKAQVITLLGGFSGWGPENGGTEVTMSTTDNIVYTLTGFTFMTDTTGKFRQDNSWANNWGGAAFPSGTGVSNGVNIPIIAGTYNITFNFVTKEYNFVAVSTGFDAIGFYGGFNSWATPSTPMVTADGVTYLKSNFQFTADGVKFIKDNNTSLTWGGTNFPSGTATVGGSTIPLTSGFYNVDFNKNTLGYNFQQVPVSLIGSGIGSTTTDLYLTSTDGGVTFSDAGIELFAGTVKFRANSNWDVNWSSTSFPTGTGVQTGTGNDIPTQPGIYTVAFNRVTGDYTFTLTQATVDTVQIVGLSGSTAMSTADGNAYTANDFYTDGTGTGFANATSSTVYGGTAYPAGTAVAGSTNPIPVPAGYYNVTFNKTTLAYSFTVTPVAIIGSATPNGWTTETPMNTTDNGVNFTLSNITLTDGEAKFRSNNTWNGSPNWGATDFPSGTATVSGPNIPVVAGTYDVSFNRTTGAYSFTNLSAAQFSKGTLAIYPNPANSYFTINADVTNVEVFNITGQLVKSFTASQQYNISDLSSGLYVVKAKDANNKVSTAKLVVE